MSRLDYPITWDIGARQLVLNNHRTEDGQLDEGAIESGYYQVEAYDFSPLDIREQREAMHLLIGGDFGPANRTFRHISLRGNIVAPSWPVLEDMEAALLAGFDLDHAQLDNPTDFGVGVLKHRSPTTVSAPGIGAVVREGFYCRPESYPITFARRGVRGVTRSFLAQLAAAYPYRCLFPQSEVVWGGNPTSLPNWTPSIGGMSRLTMKLVLAGAGASNFSVTDGTRSLALDLSLVGAGTYYIEMWSKQLYDSGGTDRSYIRTSNIDSFFDVPPGGCEFSLYNTTNISSFTAIYHQTRA